MGEGSIAELRTAHKKHAGHGLGTVPGVLYNVLVAMSLTKFARGVMWTGTMDEADRKNREDWWARTPFERLRALEHIRQLNHGYYGKGRSRPQFQRVLKVAKSGGR